MYMWNENYMKLHITEMSRMTNRKQYGATCHALNLDVDRGRNVKFHVSDHTGVFWLIQ